MKNIAGQAWARPMQSIQAHDTTQVH